jgi:hypothetical protein
LLWPIDGDSGRKDNVATGKIGKFKLESKRKYRKKVPIPHSADKDFKGLRLNCGLSGRNGGGGPHPPEAATVVGGPRKALPDQSIWT